MINEEIRLPEADIPVRSQGLRPTCLAFAASDLNHRYAPDQLSPEFIYRAAALTITGWQPGNGLTLPAVQTASSKGQPLEVDFPYEQNEPPHPIPPLPAHLSCFGSQLRLVNNSLASVIAEVRSGRPVGLALRVTEDFYKPIGDEVPTSTSRIMRGMLHAVVAVGFGTKSDASEWILVRNSWGPTWGHEGKAWLPGSYITAHSAGAFGVV